MLLLVLCNYAKFLKHVEVKHISYGNFEARDKDANRAPFVNLLPLAQLQDWTFAAADYLENGNAHQLNSLAKSALLPQLKDNSLRTANVEGIQQFVSNLEKIVTERLLCRGPQIVEGKTRKHLYDSSEKITHVVIPALAPIFQKLIVTPPVNLLQNFLDAAEWCYGKRLYQQALTILQEGFISYICQCNGLDIYERDNRGAVTKVCNRLSTPTPKMGDDSEDTELVKHLMRTLSPEVANLIHDIGDLRNDFNHCGFRKSPLGTKAIKDNLQKYIQTSKDLLLNKAAVQEMPFVPSVKSSATASQHACPKLFLNLSNHPSAQWSPQQRHAAQAFGDIRDWEFPQIPSEADAVQIARMAQEAASKIIELAQDHDLTVHVMGEMTFTFQLVERLKAFGIRCVASTTKRVVEEDGDKRTYTFKFVQFREY